MQSVKCVFSKRWITSPLDNQTLGSGLWPKGKGGKSKNAVFRAYLIRTSAKQGGDTASPHLGAPAPGTQGNARHPEAPCSRGAGAAEQGHFERTQTHHSGLLLWD